MDSPPRAHSIWSSRLITAVYEYLSPLEVLQMQSLNRHHYDELIPQFMLRQTMCFPQRLVALHQGSVLSFNVIPHTFSFFQHTLLRTLTNYGFAVVGDSVLVCGGSPQPSEDITASTYDTTPYNLHILALPLSRDEMACSTCTELLHQECLGMQNGHLSPAACSDGTRLAFFVGSQLPEYTKAVTRYDAKNNSVEPLPELPNASTPQTSALFTRQSESKSSLWVFDNSSVFVLAFDKKAPASEFTSVDLLSGVRYFAGSQIIGANLLLILGGSQERIEKSYIVDISQAKPLVREGPEPPAQEPISVGCTHPSSENSLFLSSSQVLKFNVKNETWSCIPVPEVPKQKQDMFDLTRVSSGAVAGSIKSRSFSGEPIEEEKKESKKEEQRQLTSAQSYQLSTWNIFHFMSSYENLVNAPFAIEPLIDIQNFGQVDLQQNLEENLLFSFDGKEVIFQVFQDQSSNVCLGKFLTINLASKCMRIWYKDTFLRFPSVYHSYLQMQQNMGANNSQLTLQVQDLKPTHMIYLSSAHFQVRRSMKNFCQVEVSIQQWSNLGDLDEKELCLKFTSIYKLFMFMEMLDKIRSNQVSFMTLQKTIKTDAFLKSLPEEPTSPLFFTLKPDRQEDSEEEEEIDEKLQGDIGGSHRGSLQKKRQLKNQLLAHHLQQDRDFKLKLNQMLEIQLKSTQKSMLLQDEDIKILALTWNMARTYQEPSFKDLIPDAEKHDLVVLTFQETKKRGAFLQKLDDYMQQQGFVQLGSTYMWEMMIVAYVIIQKRKYVGKVFTSTKACGLGKVFGNKGGINLQFQYRERYFSFIGCHLVHGQDGRLKRDAMMEDLLREKSFRCNNEDYDCDAVVDYAFIMGDLNYRMNSTYEDIIHKFPDKIYRLYEDIDELDQLTQSKKGGDYQEQLPDGRFISVYRPPKFPFYEEAKIGFLPTYKLNMNDSNYKNKKSQAPSYCDRILLKNNTVFPSVTNYYTSKEKVLGSDHRPVLLSVCLKQHSRPAQAPSADALGRGLKKSLQDDALEEDGALEREILRKMNLAADVRLGKFMHLDLSQGTQCYGQLTFNFVRVSLLRLPLAVQKNLQAQLMKQPVVQGRDTRSGHLTFQISFFGDFLYENCKSNEQLIHHKVQDEVVGEIAWEEKFLPKLLTPVNSAHLLAKKKLMLVIWCKDLKESQVVGYVNLRLDDILKAQQDQTQQFMHQPPRSREMRADTDAPVLAHQQIEVEPALCLNINQQKIVFSNSVVGQIDLKLKYLIESKQRAVPKKPRLSPRIPKQSSGVQVPRF